MEILYLLITSILLLECNAQLETSLSSSSNLSSETETSIKDFETTTYLPTKNISLENFENTTTISQDVNDISNFQNNTILLNKNDEKFPESCKGRQKLSEQPVQNEYSQIKKCCPYGESLHGEDGKYCETNAKNNLNITVINVILYEKCIEDTEMKISLDYKIDNPCNVSFIYSTQNGDILYIIQNGSLLILDEHRNESYQIENDYCLDINYDNGELYAIVCSNSIESHIGKGQTILFTTFMLCSIICLLIVSYLHFIIDELRTLHGLCVGLLSCSLIIGFFLHSIAQLINDIDQIKIGYAVQYFIIGYFFWLFILCVNIAITVWYFIPRYITVLKKQRFIQFVIYLTITTLLPLILVLITKHKGLNGMPSYFYQGWSESIRSSQRYFIPPVTIVLIICAILLVATYKGFNNIEKVIETQRIDFELYRETKKDFKCILYLTLIIITTWIFEIGTFYLPSIAEYLVMMEAFNCLQGVFILMIFIGIRNRRYVIIRWWYDRGTLDIDNNVEMRNLNSNNLSKIHS